MTPSDIVLFLKERVFLFGELSEALLLMVYLIFAMTLYPLPAQAH